MYSFKVLYFTSLHLQNTSYKKIHTFLSQHMETLLLFFFGQDYYLQRRRHLKDLDTV